MTSEQIILGEMGLYFSADELQLTPEFVTRYADWIRHSAERMKSAAGADGLDGLVALLRELCIDRQAPLHKRLTSATMIDWADDEYEIFQQLVAAWIAGLMGTSAPASALAPSERGLREVTYEYGNENNPVAMFG